MKLGELQKKYIVPLQKLKEKNAQKKSGEMKRIDEVLDVLMSSRKIKMENLVNIESVLFKLFTNKSSSSVDSGSVDRTPMSADKAAHSAAGTNTFKFLSFCNHFYSNIITLFLEVVKFILVKNCFNYCSSLYRTQVQSTTKPCFVKAPPS